MLSQPMPARVKVKKAMHGLELGGWCVCVVVVVCVGGKVRCGVGIEVKIVVRAYQ